MTQTVNTGHAPIVIDVVEVVVDCIIERIDTPTDPGTQTYNLMASTKNVNLSPNFLQYPPCDYAITESISWEIQNIPDHPTAIQSTGNYGIAIQSNVLSIHGVYTVTLKNAVSYNDRGTAQSWTPSVTFNVDIKDPCKTTTI